MASDVNISITSNVSAGRPLIDRAGISVEAVAKRHLAGETVAELAADYELTEEEIDAALRYVGALLTAA